MVAISWNKHYKKRNKIDMKMLLTIALIILAILVFTMFYMGRLNKISKVREIRAYQLTCIMNLKWIEDAKIKYAEDHKLSINDNVTISDLVSNKYISFYPRCPLEYGAKTPVEGFLNSYDINSVGHHPVCKILPEMHSLDSVVAQSNESIRIGHMK